MIDRVYVTITGRKHDCVCYTLSLIRPKVVGKAGCQAMSKKYGKEMMGLVTKILKKSFK